jgi:neprilysin
LRDELKAIINEPIQDNEIEPFKNVKRLYKACTNTSQVELLGSQPVEDVLDWPVLVGQNWNTPDTWTWQRAMVDSKNKGYSVSYLFSFSVSSDNKDTTKRIIRV